MFKMTDYFKGSKLSITFNGVLIISKMIKYMSNLVSGPKNNTHKEGGKKEQQINKQFLPPKRICIPKKWLAPCPIRTSLSEQLYIY
jgi:hypothetical protein